MRLEEIIRLILNGAAIEINEPVDNIRVQYKETNEKGELVRKYKYIDPKQVVLGIQYKSDNLDVNDPSSAANISVAEATTIAYPIRQLWEEIEKINNRLDNLER